MEINFSDSGRVREGSIFLAGPTPRSPDVLSWRRDAIKLFELCKFNGVLTVPERGDWVPAAVEDQIAWELANLRSARVIMFWVPREMSKMPGLTTNHEFGYFIAKRAKNVIYGRPNRAPSTRYLDEMYRNDCLRSPDVTLLATVESAFAHYRWLGDRWRG